MGCADSKKDYLLLRDRVVACLNAADPMGLLAGPSATDDYAVEATLVTARLVRARSEADLAEEIRAIFARQFSPDAAGAADEYRALASQLWALAPAGRGAGMDPDTWASAPRS